jgi:Zn-dependent peptidase ImmA (M78 family)
VLSWARSRLNLSVQQVVEESRKLAKGQFAPISEEELTAWEAGTGEPDLVHLETLAEIYACPVGWFFLESPPAENLPVSFRGLAKPLERLEPLSQRTLRRFMELADWTVEILRSTGHPWQVGIRPVEAAPTTADAERLAVQYRDRFGWTPELRRQLAGKPGEAFKWWRRAIEAQGAFCFELPLDSQETRGAALWLEGYPFLLVNHRDMEAAAGRIFTLLHEFAHLISAKQGVVCDFQGSAREENPEPFANQFAARMLVTPEELRHRLRELGQERRRAQWADSLLDALREPFFASRDVVAILLEELALAPRGFYEQKRRRWALRTLWGRGSRPLPLNQRKLQEVGYSLASLLARAADRPEFSWLDAASLLGMKVERAEAFLKWVEQHTE